MGFLARFISNRRLNAGLSLLKGGRADEAATRFERALAADPGNVHARLHLARAHADAGRPDAARDCAEAAVSDAPDEPAVLILAGEVRFDAGDEHEARQLFLRALKRNPQNRLARAYALLTRWRLTGDDAWARKLLERGLPDSSGFVGRALMCVEERFRTVPRAVNEVQGAPGPSPLLPFLSTGHSTPKRVHAWHPSSDALLRRSRSEGRS